MAQAWLARPGADASMASPSQPARDEEKNRLSMGDQWSDDIVICRRYAPSGTRIPREFCHSRAESRPQCERGRDSARNLTR